MLSLADDQCMRRASQNGGSNRELDVDSEGLSPGISYLCSLRLTSYLFSYVRNEDNSACLMGKWSDVE